MTPEEIKQAAIQRLKQIISLWKQGKITHSSAMESVDAAVREGKL